MRSGIVLFLLWGLPFLFGCGPLIGPQPLGGKMASAEVLQDERRNSYFLRPNERPDFSRMACNTDMDSGWRENLHEGPAVHGRPANSMSWAKIVTCGNGDWSERAYIYRLFDTQEDVFYAWSGVKSFLSCVAFADGPIFCTEGISDVRLGHHSTLILGADEQYRLRVTLLKNAPDPEKGVYSRETLAEREFVIAESQLKQ